MWTASARRRFGCTVGSPNHFVPTDRAFVVIPWPARIDGPHRLPPGRYPLPLPAAVSRNWASEQGDRTLESSRRRVEQQECLVENRNGTPDRPARALEHPPRLFAPRKWTIDTPLEPSERKFCASEAQACPIEGQSRSPEAFERRKIPFGCPIPVFDGTRRAFGQAKLSVDLPIQLFGTTPLRFDSPIRAFAAPKRHGDFARGAFGQGWWLFGITPLDVGGTRPCSGSASSYQGDKEESAQRAHLLPTDREPSRFAARGRAGDARRFPHVPPVPLRREKDGPRRFKTGRGGRVAPRADPLRLRWRAGASGLPGGMRFARIKLLPE